MWASCRWTAPPRGRSARWSCFSSPGCPDFIFVLDRDAAIASEGAKLAQEIMENELVMRTTAYQNGRVIYLAHPTAWYTAEGGVTALDQMLSDLEAALL